MDYTKRFNELLAELNELLEAHNDEIYAEHEYSLIYKADDGLHCAGSGNIVDQLAMLTAHMDSCRRAYQRATNRDDIPAKTWGAIAGAMYASTHDGKENNGEFSTTTIEFKL